VRDLPIQGYEVLQTTFAYPLDIVPYVSAYGVEARVWAFGAGVL
jgi:hypothetical protein